MRLLDTVFWIFFGGVVLWILGVWISMLIPRRASRSVRHAAGSGGGFADTGVSSLSAVGSLDSGSSGESASADAGGGESGGGDFSGGGGESGGGGSSGSW